MQDTLPQPSPEALAFSQALTAHLRTLIEAQGKIPFYDFMQLALYHPEFGYYRNGLAKFGKAGDFVTAPEISPLFGYCLAQFCQPLLSQTSTLLEIGAGSGILAANLLRSLEEIDALPERYLILELSAELQQRQQQTLQQHCPHLLPRVQWLSQLPEQSFQGVIIANEVLDAMPVHLFEKQQNRFYQVCVTVEKDNFAWQNQVADPQLVEQLSDLETALGYGLPEAYRSEINPAVSGWLQGLSQCLNQGAILLLDYGFPAREFYHPQRQQGTLMCHYQHRAHDNPFLYPGLQDLTAHVDFTAVAEAAIQHELQVAGYTTQAGFLLSCGLVEKVTQLNQSQSLEQQMAMNQQVKQLTHPSEMGELFKAIALTKNWKSPIMGFTFNDLRGKL